MSDKIDTKRDKDRLMIVGNMYYFVERVMISACFFRTAVRGFPPTKPHRVFACALSVRAGRFSCA